MARVLSVSSLILTLAVVCSCAAASLPAEPGRDGGTPVISRIQPATGPTGTVVTLRGGGFSAQNNIVKFGNGYIGNIPSPDGTTLTFKVPSELDLCRPNAPGPCPLAIPPVTPGEYAVAVISADQTSNSLTFTVTPQ